MRRVRIVLLAAVTIGALVVLSAAALSTAAAAASEEPVEQSAQEAIREDALAVVDGGGPLGAWSELGNWPLVAIHAAVLDNGKVLSYTGTNDTLLVDVWDPALGLGSGSHSTFNNPLGSNLFCSFTLDDPNSENKLLVGGEIAGNQVPNFVAQYGNDTLSAFPSMNEPRWYPTVTTLWDGRLLAQGGTPGTFSDRDNPTTVAEVYSPDDGWQLLEGTRDPGVWDTENYGWWYPKSHVTPSGKVWNVAWDQMYYLDPDGAGAVDVLGTFPGGNRGSSSASVMYDTGLVLQVGGGERGSDDTRFAGSNAATIINLNYDPPLLTEAAPMNFGRHWADAVVLPDGRVLVTGGSAVNNKLGGVAFTPEIWDPATNTWTMLAPNETPRLYHSTTLLLPDASVLTAGGGKAGPVDNFNGELFYPPNLYDTDGTPAARPVITSAPRNIGYDQTFSIGISGGSADRVTLIKQGNSTHSMSTQIFQELSFTQAGNQLSVQTPDYATVATPGEYLLFVLDGNGVPSVARTVRLTGTGLNPPPPLDPPGDATSITGIVARDGSAGGVAGVAVDLFAAAADGSRGQWLTTATTDASGNYTFGDLAPGCYVLTFIAPSGDTFTNGSQWFQPGSCVQDGDVNTVNATLSPGADGPTGIGGTVGREGSTGGVSDVAVDLFVAAGDGSRGQWLTTAITGTDGSYLFDDLGPGCYVLTFIAPTGETFTNGSQWFQPGSCVQDGEVSTVNATLSPVVGGSTGISGTVGRAGTGAGVAGVVVDLFVASGDGSRGQWITSTTTDAAGDYTFDDVGAGCFVLTFIAPSGETFTNGSQWFQPGVCPLAGQTNIVNATLS